MHANLKTLPRKSKNMNHYLSVIEPKNEYQIDMMHMPYDGGYRYVFVLCDISTTFVYGLPTNTKQPSEKLECFKIFETKLKFKKGTIFTSDNGSEFRGYFQQYMKQQGYNRVNVEVGNHRQLCFVNNAILHLTKAIFTSTDDQQWVNKLSSCIRSLNESRQENCEKPNQISMESVYQHQIIDRYMNQEIKLI